MLPRDRRFGRPSRSSIPRCARRLAPRGCGRQTLLACSAGSVAENSHFRDTAIEIALLDWGGEGPLACSITRTDSVRRPAGPRRGAVARPLSRDRDGRSGPRRFLETRRSPTAIAGSLLGETSCASPKHSPPSTPIMRVTSGLGHSFGGIAILMASAERPDLFERNVLVDPVILRTRQRAPAASGTRPATRSPSVLATGARSGPVAKLPGRSGWRRSSSRVGIRGPWISISPRVSPIAPTARSSSNAAARPRRRSSKPPDRSIYGRPQIGCGRRR